MSDILVVESDPVFAAVVEDRLREGGCRVEVLPDRDEAVATACHSPVDLLILEVTQPDGGGLEVVRSLRDHGETRALPILVLSSSAESADRVAALRAGADDYLTKPCDLEELQLRAERLVGSRASMAPVLQGDLANYPLWELMQYLQQARKSGDLVLRGPTDSGRVHVEQGRITDAGWERLSGREALLAVLGMKQGSFRFVSGATAPAARRSAADLDAHEVLMQAAWLEDELEKRRRYLPTTGMPLETTGVEPQITGAGLDVINLTVKQIHELVREEPGLRLFDLIKRLRRAPQTVRLAVACLVEAGAMKLPKDGTYASTGEIASALLVEMAVNEFLTSARAAGFGTSALPFLILVEPGPWPELLQLLQSVPGYFRNDTLRGFVKQLKEREGGCARFSSDLGKLSLNVRLLSDDTVDKVEGITTVCAGVLLWLDRARDEETLRKVIRRLEAVRSEAVGVIVASDEALPVANRLVEGTRRWRVSSHAPHTLFGVFRLMQPSSG